MAALIAAVSTGCRKTAGTSRLEPLRIGFLRDPLATLLYVAEATDAFHRQGLDVAFLPYDGGAYAIADLAAGSIDFAVATEYALVQRELRAA